MLNGKRVLVTGADGFIGSHLAEALVEDGANVVALCQYNSFNQWGWLDDSPLRKLTKPKEPRGRIRFLSDEERERLLTACKESQNPYLFTVIVVALSTGMRHGEILKLRWTDIDFARGRIVLHETKNGERRVVPLALLLASPGTVPEDSYRLRVFARWVVG